ncbi:unnamed protein product [Pedinophyceae sp. YPF-701]|nr:unnamed protein product [Pedinophyceae sp. YPF-701]
MFRKRSAKKVEDAKTQAGDEGGGNGAQKAGGGLRAGARKAGVSTLSFEDEEEEPQVVLKRDRQKKKSERKERKRAQLKLPGVDPDAAHPPKESRGAWGGSAAGEYSKERLAELRNQHLGGVAAPPPADDAAMEAPMIRGAFKPATAEGGAPAGAPPRPQREAPSNGGGAEDDVERFELHKLAGRDIDLAKIDRPEGIIMEGMEDSGGEDGDFPDAEAIRRAKEQRERRRRGGLLSTDYAPGGSGHSMDDLRERLRREDLTGAHDASGDDSEQDEDARKRVVFGAMGGGDRDGAGDAGPQADDDDDEFVKGQLRRAMGASVRRAQDARERAGQAPSAGASVEEDAWSASPAATAAALDEAGAAAEAAVFGGLERMERRAQQARSHLERTTEQLTSSLDHIEALEGKLAASGERFEHMQALEEYLVDLCACLGEKCPLIAEMERHLERAASACGTEGRRAAALARDRELALGQGAVQGALQAASRGAGPAETAEAARKGWQAVERRQLVGADVPVELDEDGNDRNAARRAAAKAEAQALAAARNAAPPAGALPCGWVPRAHQQDVGPGSYDGALREYGAALTEVVEAAPTVFADAADEFASIAPVKARLEQCKREFPSAYRDAYLAMSAPALFAPFVRTELLRWDPLLGALRGADGPGGVAPAALDEHDWFDKLEHYGEPWGEDGDEDEDLVPRLVEQIVLPRLSSLLRDVWDAREPRLTRAAVAAVSDALVYVPPDGQAAEAVAGAVRDGIDRSCATVALPSWPMGAVEGVPEAMGVLSRLYSDALVVLGACLQWREVLSVNNILAQVAPSLLAKKIVPFLSGLSSISEQNRAVAVCALEDFVEVFLQRGDGGADESLLASQAAQAHVAGILDAARKLQGSCRGDLASRVGRVMRALQGGTR